MQRCWSHIEHWGQWKHEATSSQGKLTLVSKARSARVADCFELVPCVRIPFLSFVTMIKSIDHNVSHRHETSHAVYMSSLHLRFRLALAKDSAQPVPGCHDWTCPVGTAWAA